MEKGKTGQLPKNIVVNREDKHNANNLIQSMAQQLNLSQTLHTPNIH